MGQYNSVILISTPKLVMIRKDFFGVVPGFHIISENSQDSEFANKLSFSLSRQFKILGNLIINFCVKMAKMLPEHYGHSLE